MKEIVSPLPVRCLLSHQIPCAIFSGETGARGTKATDRFLLGAQAVGSATVLFAQREADCGDLLYCFKVFVH